MLFTSHFRVPTDFCFTTFYAVKLLAEGMGGHISESVRPFKPADSAMIRPARPQAHSLVGTVQQIPSAHSAGKTDSAKPSWTGLNLPTSLLGDVAPFSRSVSEAQPFQTPPLHWHCLPHWRYHGGCVALAVSLGTASVWLIFHFITGSENSCSCQRFAVTLKHYDKTVLAKLFCKYSFHGVKIKVQKFKCLAVALWAQSPRLVQLWAIAWELITTKQKLIPCCRVKRKTT